MNELTMEEKIYLLDLLANRADSRAGVRIKSMSRTEEVNMIEGIQLKLNRRLHA